MNLSDYCGKCFTWIWGKRCKCGRFVDGQNQDRTPDEFDPASRPEWHALAGGPISLVSQQNPETGEWEPAVPLQDSYRHWPWLQRIVDWLWSRKASNQERSRDDG